MSHPSLMGGLVVLMVLRESLEPFIFCILLSLFGEGFFPLGFLLCLRFAEISLYWVPDQALLLGPISFFLSLARSAFSLRSA